MSSFLLIYNKLNAFLILLGLVKKFTTDLKVIKSQSFLKFPTFLKLDIN